MKVKSCNLKHGISVLCEFVKFQLKLFVDICRQNCCFRFKTTKTQIFCFQELKLQKSLFFNLNVFNLIISKIKFKLSKFQILKFFKHSILDQLIFMEFHEFRILKLCKLLRFNLELNLRVTPSKLKNYFFVATI